MLTFPEGTRDEWANRGSVWEHWPIRGWQSCRQRWEKRTTVLNLHSSFGHFSLVWHTAQYTCQHLLLHTRWCWWVRYGGSYLSFIVGQLASSTWTSFPAAKYIMAKFKATWFLKITRLVRQCFMLKNWLYFKELCQNRPSLCWQESWRDTCTLLKTFIIAVQSHRQWGGDGSSFCCSPTSTPF